MRLEKASYKAIRLACMKFHYAKSVPVNVFGFSVFNKQDEWCGCIVYGSGANNNLATQYNLVQGEVVELVRVALNGKQGTTSKALAISLRLLPRYLPLVKLVVSYADLDQNHIGTIYKATNWYFTGISMRNKPDASFIINGQRIHGKTLSDKCKRNGLKKTKENIKKIYRTENVKPYITKGKIKYLYPIDKNYVSLCENLSKTYLKNAQEA